jgi:hypothetical protein
MRKPRFIPNMKAPHQQITYRCPALGDQLGAVGHHEGVGSSGRAVGTVEGRSRDCSSGFIDRTAFDGEALSGGCPTSQCLYLCSRPY